MNMQLRLQFQQSEVADEVSAITAVVRPILEGLLYSLKGEVVLGAGGHENLPLYMLARLYEPADRDCGICFEYAVHDALRRGQPGVVERVSEAISKCNVNGTETASLLFGLEKAGALNLIDSVKEQLTDESRLQAGTRGQPAKLKRHIDSLAAAFRRRDVRDSLPWSISGLWRADLFVGFSDTDRWIGTTVKINPLQLEGGRGLRIGIVPARQGASDLIQMDDGKNLQICPLPYDGSFMETFYQGWTVVRQFFAAGARVPKEVYLPRNPDRQVARYLAERRNFPVLEVLNALEPLAQPQLLTTQEQDVNLVSRRESSPPLETESVVAPVPLVR